MKNEIKRDGYTVKLSDPVIYVDNESRGRSGHMTHALAEWKPGHLIDFNSNCSAFRDDGHSTFGWVEYRLSEDGGQTFSEIYDLPYSKKSLLDGIYAISVEKAVACDNGAIVAICLRNDACTLCQPWDTPMTVISYDGGKTWSEPSELCSYKGRVYDARYYKGKIYVLEFCNDGTGCFCGEKEEHLYRIFVSEDNGKTFEELCVVPIPTKDRGYGSLLFDNEGKLHVYAYNLYDEYHLDHVVSNDCGKTWGDAEKCFVAKGNRNPQTAIIDGIFVLHARIADEKGFAIYTSKDGYTWDEGEMIGYVPGTCYYSNNIVLKDKEGKSKMLIQYSESYKTSCVNVKHLWLTIEKNK